MTDVVAFRHSPLLPATIPAAAGELLGGTNLAGVAVGVAIGGNLTLSGGVLSANGVAFTVSTVTATGASQVTASAISSCIAMITGVSGGNCVILTAASPWYDVRNRSGAVIYIYPPSGEQMEGTAGINLPVILPNGSNVIVARDTSPTTPTWRT